ncbi:MAG: hypothetical protein SNJ59_14840 [Aggregatilineales bacterium]
MTEYNRPPEEATDETLKDKPPFEQFLHHQRRMLEETGKALDALLPEGFKTHSREARREFIQGMKVLVDATVEGLEQASRELDKNFRRAPRTSGQENDRPKTTGTNKVKVNVD